MGDFPRRIVYTVTMQKNKVHSFSLTADNYRRLCVVAEAVGAVAKTGRRAGQPSPATLMLEIARGSIECYTLDCAPQ